MATPIVTRFRPWWENLHCSPGVMLLGGWVIDRKNYRAQSIGSVKPNLIVIGAQKAGTTSLHSYLAAHPDIHMSNPWKESRYFVFEEWARAYMRDVKGIEVSSRAELVKKYMLNGYRFQRYLGESVPDYTFHNRAAALRIPQKIKATSPGARLIYILRNPIARIISSYFHSRKYGGEKRSISECLCSSGHYLSTSLYAKQLAEFYKEIRPEEIKVIFLEELSKEAGKTMSEVFEFLGLQHVPFASYPVHNTTSPEDKKILSVGDYELLINPLREDIAALRRMLHQTLPDWDLRMESWVNPEKSDHSSSTANYEAS